jgi:predicted DsbA family dithiol-disulfide isomerase
MTPVEGAAASVSIWFDPICPWTWVTSRWLLEVAGVRPVTIEWRMLSLAYLNLVQRDGLEPSAEMRKPVAAQYLRDFGWKPIRLCAAAAAERGPCALEPMYSALGRRLHVDQRHGDDDIFLEAVQELGLPDHLAQSVTSTELDEVILRSHHEAFDDVGLDVGSPVIAVDGRGYYGPVLTALPRGDDSERLWDGFVLMSRIPEFHELKRSRDDGGPDVSSTLRSTFNSQ